MQDLDKKISEFQEIETFGDNAVIPVVQGNPLDNYKITPKNFSKEIMGDVQAEVGKRFLSRVLPDYALERITFNKGITSNGITKLQDTEFGTYQSGMYNGSGGKIDSDGNAELTSLTLRAFLEAPEYRYNRLTLIGEEIAIGAGAIIETVEETPSGYTLGLKLEEGELNPFWVDDIIKGIFNQGGGFSTTWARVTDSREGFIDVILGADEAVYGNKNYPPREFMNIARWGNFTVKERQSVMFLSAKTSSIQILDGLDNYKGGYINAQWGKPAGLESIIDFSKLPINKNDSYLYTRGLLVQDIIKVDYKGRPLKEYRDRGVWSSINAINDPYQSTIALQDEAWVGADKYRCITNETTDKPSKTSQNWILVLSIKDEIIENNPTVWDIFAVNVIEDAPLAIFHQGDTEELHELTVRPMFVRNGSDVTDIMNQSDVRLYEFQRKNMFGVDDRDMLDSAWNQANLGRTEVTFTHKDIMFIGNVNIVFDDEILEQQYQLLK